jgi:hypothetical protein
VPAAAVIPAPIAYIKVVAVKKLVVELQTWLDGLPHGTYCPAGPYLLVSRHALHWVCRGTRTFTLRKLECSKQALCSNTLAWNNKIGRAVLFCWFLESP